MLEYGYSFENCTKISNSTTWFQKSNESNWGPPVRYCSYCGDACVVWEVVLWPWGAKHSLKTVNHEWIMSLDRERDRFVMKERLDGIIWVLIVLYMNRRCCYGVVRWRETGLKCVNLMNYLFFENLADNTIVSGGCEIRKWTATHFDLVILRAAGCHSHFGFSNLIHSGSGCHRSLFMVVLRHKFGERIMKRINL